MTPRSPFLVNRRDAAVIICFRSGTAAATPAPTTWSPPAWAAAYATSSTPPPRSASTRSYLEDAHTAFYEAPSPIRLASCSYLHNYVDGDGDVLFADRFRSILDRERPSQRVRIASISSASRFSSGRTRRYSRASTSFTNPSSA